MKSKFSTITTPTFESRYHKLRKKYPEIDEDFEAFLNEVELVGDLGEDIPNVVKDENTVYLLDIYSKSYQEDISKKKILNLIKNNIPEITFKRFH